MAARGTAEWLLWLVPALALMLAALAASASGALPRTAADFAVAAGCAAVVLALSRGPERTGAGQPAWGRGARFLAGFSYTLYLTHLPLLVLGQAWVVQAGGGRWQPDALHLGLGLGLAGAALAYAWLFSLATEARTDALRRLVFERRVAAG